MTSPYRGFLTPGMLQIRLFEGGPRRGTLVEQNRQPGTSDERTLTSSSVIVRRPSSSSSVAVFPHPWPARACLRPLLYGPLKETFYADPLKETFYAGPLRDVLCGPALKGRLQRQSPHGSRILESGIWKLDTGVMRQRSLESRACGQERPSGLDQMERIRLSGN